MTIDAALLRSTLEYVLAADDTFPQRFYEILFERHPEVRALFHRNSVGAQNKMFAQKLTAIVDHVEDSDYIAREVVDIAVSHTGYGVRDEMYGWVGEALIATLREGCGELFTAEAEGSWREAYGGIEAEIQRVMRERGLTA